MSVLDGLRNFNKNRFFFNFVNTFVQTKIDFSSFYVRSKYSSFSFASYSFFFFLIFRRSFNFTFYCCFIFLNERWWNIQTAEKILCKTIELLKFLIEVFFTWERTVRIRSNIFTSLDPPISSRSNILSNETVSLDRRIKFSQRWRESAQSLYIYVYTYIHKYFLQLVW